MILTKVLWIWPSQRSFFILKSVIRPTPTGLTVPTILDNSGRIKTFANVMPSCDLCSSSSILNTHRCRNSTSDFNTRNLGTESTGKTYEDAIRHLNTLQSNVKTLQNWSKNRHLIISAEEVLSDTVGHLERGGLTLDELDTLNVVHVSGTKGKGTTCAFVESILRHAGLRTGFYSSPHLIAVRERIRIDGRPLSKEKFAKYFFHVYENMDASKKTENDMPAYFRFLTCMAFYAFFHEKVDVVVLEVGMGGTMDATNIVRKPIVTGITSLALEHQNVLGNTLEEISLAKAGIMKSGVPCFTLPTHSTHILQILQEHARKVKCPLFVAPPLNSYEKLPMFKDENPVTHLNASLAIQLANTFMLRKYPQKYSGKRPTMLGKSFSLLPWHRAGLSNCFWPGRFQILQRNSRLTYFLDGAHTVESLTSAHDWFTRHITNEKSSLRVLVFNVTGERNAEEMMRPLALSGQYDSAVFCPIVTTKPGGADNWSAYAAVKDGENVMENSIKLASIWKRVCPVERPVELLCHIDETVEYLDKLSKDRKVNVLVTGSVHLVGAFLSLLDPGLTSTSPKLTCHKLEITREQ